MQMVHVSREHPPPQVAVVIPCYNHGEFLPEALRSVRAQRYQNIDCVVVDDGSTDPGTLKTLARMGNEGVRVIRQDNQGLSTARNAGVRATTAPFFVPLDADDKLAPEFVGRLLPKLLDDPALGYCYSHVQCFGASAALWECAPYDPRRLLVENLSVATAVIRRAAFDEVGGYRRDMIHGFEDWDFWLALLSAGYFGACVPEPLFHYRRHAGGSMLSEAQRRRPEMVRKMIAHHRSLFAALLDVSPVDDEIYQTLLAQAELAEIENSRFWRLARRLTRNPLPNSKSRSGVQTEREGDHSTEDPRARLARIKAGWVYRLIQAVKRTSLYKWYGRRKYGPQFDQPSAGVRR